MAIKEKNITSGLDLSARPPFTTVIINYKHLAKFRPPNLDLYDKTKDPFNYVQSFKSYIIFLRAFDEMI